MATIDVIAKVTGMHAASGLYLEKGKPYTIAEELFGDEVFENVTVIPEQDNKQAAKKKEG